MKQFTLPPRRIGPAEIRLDHHLSRSDGWVPGKAKVGLLLWLLGVPLPIVLIIVLVRSCMS